MARGFATLLGIDWRRVRIARVAPHVIDTVFLASGVWLAWSLGVSPVQEPWLAAKIGGLLVYIGLGLVALRLGRTAATRGGAFAAAILVFAYIVGVAMTRSPASWVSLVA
jgi:uncharacterized membrane protein SirB2